MRRVVPGRALGLWPLLLVIAFAAAFAITVLSSGRDPGTVAAAQGGDAAPVPTWSPTRFDSAAALPPLRRERRVQRRAAAVGTEPVTPTPAPSASPTPEAVVAPSPAPSAPPPVAEHAPPARTVNPAPPTPTPTPAPTFDSSGGFDSSG